MNWFFALIAACLAGIPWTTLMTLLCAVCMVIERRKFSPPQVAKMFGVATGKVINWIKSGELGAINSADGPKKRPRYLIDRKDIESFEALRRVVPSDSTTTPRQLRKRGPGTIREYV